MSVDAPDFDLPDFDPTQLPGFGPDGEFSTDLWLDSLDDLIADFVDDVAEGEY